MSMGVTRRYRTAWPLSATEVAHAIPVMLSAHPGLRDLPPPRLATIRTLAQRWSVRDGALRTALSRACSAGWLEHVDGRYRLGPLSVEAADAARALLARRPGYTLVLIGEGERLDLPALRALLTTFGLRSLQRSTWIGARTEVDGLRPALERAGFDGGVMVFLCDEIDDRTRERLVQLWGIDERAAELRAFHQLIGDYVDAADDVVERAWRHIEVTPVWYRVAILDEPPFPLELLGVDYPLAQLRADWTGRLQSITGALVDLWPPEDRVAVARRATARRRGR
jgi:DNA-binding transcriptional regulator PaaX